MSPAIWRALWISSWLAVQGAFFGHSMPHLSQRKSTPSATSGVVTLAYLPFNFSC